MSTTPDPIQAYREAKAQRALSGLPLLSPRKPKKPLPHAWEHGFRSYNYAPRPRRRKKAA